MKHYEAIVSRDGKWWMVSIPALDGLTQARRLSEAELMAREYIAVTLDVPLDQVEVTISVDAIGAVTGIASVLESVDSDRAQAAALERDASRQVSQLAKALAAESVPVRDIGTMLRVSHQRAHQLVNG
ncbi:MAG: hypothetical protein ABJB03_11475 [Rhodoglobus sp.]